MCMSFQSEEEYRDFCTGMEILEHEAMVAGKFFNWDLEAERYYQ